MTRHYDTAAFVGVLLLVLALGICAGQLARNNIHWLDPMSEMQELMR